MSESINVENKKQNRQKPPLSLGRIAGEILAGTAAGLAVVLLVYVTCAVYLQYILGHKGDIAVFEFIALFAIVCPPLYVLATASGVYFVGRIGNEMGSFMATLGGVFLGVPVVALLYLYIDMAGDMMLGIIKMVLWPLVFLAPPIMATLGYNLTRRYKEPPSS